MQKGFTPILILLFVVAVVAVASGAYFLGKSSNQIFSQPQVVTSQSRTIQNSNVLPTQSVTETRVRVTPDPYAGWQEIKPTYCSLSIKYPFGWKTNGFKFGNDTKNAGYNDFCVTIDTPDFKLIPQSDGYNGTIIRIYKTSKGINYKSSVKNTSIIVNSLEDYIKAENSSVELTNKSGSVDFIRDTQDKSFGNNQGKYYTSSAMQTLSNFIFSRGNYIYRVTWDQEYKGQYKDQLEKIISGITYLP